MKFFKTIVACVFVNYVSALPASVPNTPPLINQTQTSPPPTTNDIITGVFDAVNRQRMYSGAGSKVFRDLAMEYMPMFLLYASDPLYPSNVSFFAEHFDCNYNEANCKLTANQTYSHDLPWLRGQNVAWQFVPVYPMIVPRDAAYNVVEIHYNTFFPFNEGIFGNGKHVGDWERVSIRFDKDAASPFGYKPTFVFLSRHSPQKDSWSGRWDQVKNGPDEDNHFKVAVSNGDHANFLPYHDHLYESGLCICEKEFDQDFAKGKIPDWHAKSVEDGIAWKPYEHSEQRDYIIPCEPWDGKSRLKCNLIGHPEKHVFNKFGASKWGPADGEGLTDSPDSPIAQTEMYYGNGIECTSVNGCDRPEWCPKLECNSNPFYDVASRVVADTSNGIASMGEDLVETGKDLAVGFLDGLIGLFS